MGPTEVSGNYCLNLLYHKIAEVSAPDAITTIYIFGSSFRLSWSWNFDRSFLGI